MQNDYLADLFYLTLIAIGLILDYFMLWRGFLRRSQADPARARVWLWSAWMIMLWTLVAAGVGLWMLKGRSWASLGLIIPHGWRLLVAIGMVMLPVLNSARTVTKVMRSKRPKLVKMHDHSEKMAPHTGSELGWFVALSLSAGFCEEFLFRGYLIWAFQPVVGLWGAAAFSVVVFAAAHAYQGIKGVLATGVVGILLTVVVLVFKSLLPAIALHAFVDIGQGLVAWLVLRKVSGKSGELQSSDPTVLDHSV
jgi:hypothetical protein